MKSALDDARAVHELPEKIDEARTRAEIFKLGQSLTKWLTVITNEKNSESSSSTSTIIEYLRLFYMNLDKSCQDIRGQSPTTGRKRRLRVDRIWTMILG